MITEPMKRVMNVVYRPSLKDNEIIGYLKATNVCPGWKEDEFLKILPELRAYAEQGKPKIKKPPPEKKELEEIIDLDKSREEQVAYCIESGYDRAVPDDGVCPKCMRNIYLDKKMRKAATERRIIKCPFCYHDFTGEKDANK